MQSSRQRQPMATSEKRRARLLSALLGTSALLDAKLSQGILKREEQAQPKCTCMHGCKGNKISTWGVAESFKRALLTSTVVTAVVLSAA
jgi:hypothetical protein